MSNVVLICHRSARSSRWLSQFASVLTDRLTPDNITARAAHVIEQAGVGIIIVNPSDALPVRDGNVCLGALFGPVDAWWKPQTAAPDGSYALFRSSDRYVELVSDVVASRTLWYAKTDDLFIASTCQRAIVILLRSYEPNESAYPWMMSTGALGPGLSWDRRISNLPADARLILDREQWTTDLEQNELVFREETCEDERHERRLRRALDETFEGLRLDTGRWILPLSGGYDSRMILHMLRRRHGLSAVTWGVRSALDDKKSDAWLGRELARKYGLPHEYFVTDLSNEPVDTLFRRFLAAGEGRVDHISGYMDGFLLWKRMYESGTDGIIRGDSAFGWDPVASVMDVRQKLDLMFLSDYANLNDLALDLRYPQRLPDTYERYERESLETWRDRLYQSYRHPVIVAALNAVKSHYVEIVNPLLSRRVVTQVRAMPDHLRNGRRLFRKVVMSSAGDVPFARHVAIESSASILRSDRVTDCIVGTLCSGDAGRLLAPELLQWLVDRLERPAPPIDDNGARQRAVRFVKDLLPEPVADAVRAVTGPLRRGSKTCFLDPHKLAFRVYIICMMDALLREDAQYLERSGVITYGAYPQ